MAMPPPGTILGATVHNRGLLAGVGECTLGGMLAGGQGKGREYFTHRRNSGGLPVTCWLGKVRKHHSLLGEGKGKILKLLYF